MINSNRATHLRVVDDDYLAGHAKPNNGRIAQILGIDSTTPDAFTGSLPFAPSDATVGVENELQTAVAGDPDHADLPLYIKDSNYFKNIIKRTLSGDTPRKAVASLESYLNENADHIWENSWVRFPRAVLTPNAQKVFDQDIRSDKIAPNSPVRKDCQRFLFKHEGEQWIRTPVSYLLKLALADAICPSHCHPLVTAAGDSLMKHFLSDNTSPETYSFYTVHSNAGQPSGPASVHETLVRFLLCQFLTLYANQKFQLKQNGQQAMIYCAPNPPVRQRMLNDLISDSFYRDLFMSPCLSGWNQGEKKYAYMVLCHQVLSRSQLNAMGKLKEAGIIVNNLVVLPNTSNTCLSNNGVHISLGSLKLSRILKEKSSLFTAREEKYLGDLVIKITEHFLPLFVGTYTAAPYRIDFMDFHAEKVLGFLPHQLDFTHLRMIWRRWKKKAHLKFCGQVITPFGPEWLDRIISGLFRLKGDMVRDFRLIDYLICLMSTSQSPALDGRLENDARLKADLTDLGVFDNSMALYLLYRQRLFNVMGFSGFEGRYYSQFADLKNDMSRAVQLQNLITALAYKYIFKNRVHHQDIPDHPFIESERRQVFFGAAVGLPTFYIKKKTGNRFMAKVLAQTDHIRSSRRYAGYHRVYNAEYCSALVKILEHDAADLVEAFAMQDTLSDLKKRIHAPDVHAASGQLTRRILDFAGAVSPFKLSARDFNASAERFYREGLKTAYMQAAFEALQTDFEAIDSWESWRQGRYNRALLEILEGKNAADYLDSAKKQVLRGSASVTVLQTLIQLTLLTIDQKKRRFTI